MRLFRIPWSWMTLPAVAVAVAVAAEPTTGVRPTPKLLLTNSLDAPTAVTTSAPPVPRPGPPGDEAWAEGEGVRVTATQVAAKVSRVMAEAMAAGKTLDERELNLLRRRTLDTMVFVQLVMSRATEADTNRARVEAERRFATIRSNAPSAEVFRNTLTQAGYTEDAFRQEKFEEALVVSVIDREVKSAVRIPDSDVRRFYDEDRTRWDKPEQVKAAQIFLAGIRPDTKEKLPEAEIAEKRRRAEAALARIKAGADFAAVARDVSEDPESRERGGEYVIQRGQMFAEFDKAAWSLAPGEVSEVVRSEFGFHVFRNNGRVPARVIPFDEVSAQIREALLDGEMEVRIPEYSDRLRRAANVRLGDAAPKPFGL